MRQQYHFRQSKKGLIAWDVFRLITLAKPLVVKDYPLGKISELDESFWYDLGGASPTCKNILEHAVLIDSADLSYPIILCREGRVMDGMHRVCKAYKQGEQTIKAVQFEQDIEPDYVGVDPDELPY
ncbi:hypothetical protein MD588_20640 [Photobacterium sp. SDRW27]|uniref:hypothetical protein n=1 Tax=Photobacterium obscurum TaxID=2829490 RepID=UPI0022439C6F|nr:hypothetical protein [Photobacterium obscurum]MCW8331207.1 hypothetical protein [Photobacterium obscurum]